jgi:hypothetical protein
VEQWKTVENCRAEGYCGDLSRISGPIVFCLRHFIKSIKTAEKGFTNEMEKMNLLGGPYRYDKDEF